MYERWKKIIKKNIQKCTKGSLPHKLNHPLPSPIQWRLSPGTDNQIHVHYLAEILASQNKTNNTTHSLKLCLLCFLSFSFFFVSSWTMNDKHHKLCSTWLLLIPCLLINPTRRRPHKRTKDSSKDKSTTAGSYSRKASRMSSEEQKMNMKNERDARWAWR